MSEDPTPIVDVTEEEVEEWLASPYADLAVGVLTSILSGETTLESAREDLKVYQSIRKDYLKTRMN